MPYCPNCFHNLDANARSCNKCKSPIRGKALDKTPKSLEAFEFCIGAIFISFVAFISNFAISKKATEVLASSSTGSVLQTNLTTGSAIAWIIAIMVIALVALVLGVVAAVMGNKEMKGNSTNHPKVDFYSQLAILLGVIAMIVAVLTIVLMTKILDANWEVIKNYFGTSTI